MHNSPYLDANSWRWTSGELTPQPAPNCHRECPAPAGARLLAQISRPLPLALQLELTLRSGRRVAAAAGLCVVGSGRACELDKLYEPLPLPHSLRTAG